VLFFLFTWHIICVGECRFIWSLIYLFMKRLISSYVHFQQMSYWFTVSAPSSDLFAYCLALYTQYQNIVY
jgi:hypothetical protein